MRARCNCGKFVPIAVRTHDDIEQTGKPKQIGTGTCDCGQEVIVYASLYYPKNTNEDEGKTHLHFGVVKAKCDRMSIDEIWDENDGTL